MIFNTFNFAIIIVYRRFKESLEILFFILNVASIFLSFYFSFAIQEKYVNLIATLIFHFARTRARRAGFKRITSSSLLLSLVASRYFIPRYDCILHSNVLRDEHDNFLAPSWQNQRHRYYRRRMDSYRASLLLFFFFFFFYYFSFPSLPYVWRQEREKHNSVTQV